MKKLLLVVLTWIALAGVSRAEEVLAGESHAVKVPAVAMDAELGVITRTTNVVRRIVLRSKGMWLGSFVRKGMDLERVWEILGGNTLVLGNPMPYPGLGISVSFRTTLNAAGALIFGVDHVSIYR